MCEIPDSWCNWCLDLVKIHVRSVSTGFKSDRQRTHFATGYHIERITGNRIDLDARIDLDTIIDIIIGYVVLSQYDAMRD